MMKRISCVFFVLILLSFISCSKDSYDYASAFRQGEYQGILDAAEKELSDTIEGEALYYKAAALYQLGQYDEAFRSSFLYFLLNDESSANYYDSLRIVLHTSPYNNIALDAGGLLEDNNMLLKQNAIKYYQELVSSGDMNAAEEFFQSIAGSLSVNEIAMMNIISEAPSGKILSSLESLYGSQGLSAAFMDAMKLAIPLFINRGDGMMLYDLAGHGDGGDPAYALSLGDLMYSINEPELARRFWSDAGEAFPVQTDLRIREL